MKTCGCCILYRTAHLLSSLRGFGNHRELASCTYRTKGGERSFPCKHNWRTKPFQGFYCYRVKGYLSLDVDVSALEVNQCEAYEPSKMEIAVFHGTHKCHNSTTEVSSFFEIFYFSSLLLVELVALYFEK